MVRAVLEGRKTQTRRIVKPQPVPQHHIGRHMRLAGQRDWCVLTHFTLTVEWIKCPYGDVGDKLWVRETWAPCEAKVRKGHVQYAADGAVGHMVTTNGGERWWERSGHTMGVADDSFQGVWVSRPSRWRPSIHMPRWASRLMLEVTDVRVQRLQDISPQDAEAEGAQHFDKLPSLHPYGQDARWSMESPTSTDECLGSAKMAFANYWNKCAAGENWNLKPEREHPWAQNPWVWAVTFKMVENQ